MTTQAPVPDGEQEGRALPPVQEQWRDAVRSLPWIRRPDALRGRAGAGSGTSPADARGAEQPSGGATDLDRDAGVASGEDAERWSRGGSLCLAYAALDRHVVAGRSDTPALVHRGADGSVEVRTYAELLDTSARLAGVLRALGAAEGERVLVHLDVVPEAVVTLLACARIGAVHVLVPTATAEDALARVLDAARPVVAVTASAVGDGAVRPADVLARAGAVSARGVLHRVVLQRPGAEADLDEARDVPWSLALRPGAAPPSECLEVAAEHPWGHVVAPTGTAVEPATQGGAAVAGALRASRQGLGPDDVVLGTTDVGWRAARTALVLAPLLAGCTLVLVDVPGGDDGTEDLARALATHRPAVLVTASATARALADRGGRRAEGAAPVHLVLDGPSDAASPAASEGLTAGSPDGPRP